MEKTNKRRAIQVAIAILTGLVLWLYVDFQVTTMVTMEVKGVPVVFKGEDTTLADKNLMLLSGYETTVDLVVEGPRRTLWKMDERGIRVVADTSSVAMPGQQQLEWTVDYPNISNSSIKVKDADPEEITVTVGELYTKEVPVEYEINGEPAAGFFLGDLESDTKKLVLRAQRDDLLNVSYAKVEVNVSGATKTIIQTLSYSLYDYNDVPIENSDIRSATKMVQITLPVRTSKMVSLEVNLVGIPTDTPEAVQHTITPARVELIGEANTLETISTILLDKIYVEDLGREQTFTYEVQPPVGTMLADESVLAEVKVTVEGTEEKVLTVEDIRSDNVPDGMDVQIQNDLDVTVWGLESDVAIVEPEHLAVRVDLSTVSSAGTYTLPAIVTLQGHPDVTIKGTYTVAVTVSDQDVEANAPTTLPAPEDEATPPATGTNINNNTNNGGNTTT